MVCLSDLKYEILLKNATPKECEKYIKENCDEAYLVPGGYKVKNIPLMGEKAPVGFSGEDIIFQFIKPCFGLFILKLPKEAGEIETLRALYGKDKNVTKIK